MDIDFIFNDIIPLYSKLKRFVELNVENIFFAADLDKNHCIELKEFLTLYRYLENENSDNNNNMSVLFL